MTAIIMRREVHAEHHDGTVKVVRTGDGKVLLTLSLAAAEELAFGIERQAEQGRLLAATAGAPMSDAPRRRLELELTLGADTLEDLHDALQQIGTDLLIENREERITASGGWRSGYSLRLTVEPEMDGDRYRREVQEHVQGLKNGSQPPTVADEHTCFIGNDFLSDAWETSCSCGWVGREWPTQDEAYEDWENHCDVAFMESTMQGADDV